MRDWIIFSIAAICLYALWSIFSKVATFSIPSYNVLVWSMVGSNIAILLMFLFLGVPTGFHGRGVFFAILTGVAATVGSLFFFAALQRGNVSVVLPMTALYPVLTIVLAYFFLNEIITLKQGAGILFALTAMVLFAV